MRLVLTQFFVGQKRKQLDRDFLYYYMAASLGRSAFAAFSQRCRAAEVSTRLISEHSRCVPPLSEQRAIAHILGTLDDKIELNRRMSETLEAIARALFKSWFVDFDPVRAKAEGRDPGLPKHIADLFSSCLVDSEARRNPGGVGGGKAW